MLASRDGTPWFPVVSGVATVLSCRGYYQKPGSWRQFE
jgi:hypothetical protein